MTIALKRSTYLLAAVALLCGCATSWAASDDDVTSILPFYRFDRKNDINWIFPVAWSETGRFSVFPVFWWTKNWFVLGPYAAANEKSIGTLFPLIYWNNEAGDEHLWTLAGLWGYWRDYGKPAAHWCLPFYAKTGDGVFTIPFSRLDRKTRHTDFYLCGLGGYEGSEVGYRSSWVFPFYYHDQGRFYTLLFGNTDESSWLFPFYYRNKAEFDTLLYSSSDTGWWVLLGLAGGLTNVAGSWHENWAFPFYGSRDEVRFDECAEKLEAEQLTDVLTEKELEVGFASSQGKSFLLLCGSSESVKGRPSATEKSYSMTHTRKDYLFPLWDRTAERRVEFDRESGERRSDVESAVWRIFFIPVWW